MSTYTIIIITTTTIIIIIIIIIMYSYYYYVLLYINIRLPLGGRLQGSPANFSMLLKSIFNQIRSDE